MSRTDMKSETLRKIYFDSDKCLACHSCEFACAVEHSVTKTIECAHLEDTMPVQRRNVVRIGAQGPSGTDSASLTVGCRHCENAPCTDACISGAMARCDGYVQVDEARCVGCRMCIMVCPFDAIRMRKLSVVKCDMCPDREDFACVASCPTKALFAMTETEFVSSNRDEVAR
jgi:carbon-monoxide dehydrogenase iron sulfur subunit